MESFIDPVLIRHIKKPKPEIIAAFRKLPVANIADAIGKPCSNTMDSEIKPVLSDLIIAGPAVTVKERPDCNLMSHAAFDLAEKGDVIVIDAGGYTSTAVGGFLMVRKLISKKVEAVIVDGAWRDKTEIIEKSFPVFARGWQPGGPHKNQPGSVNIPVTCGGVIVNPGDIVVGDDDGVVVIPREQAETILEAAQAIHEREKAVIIDTRKEAMEKPNPYATPERLKELGVEIR